MIKEITNKKVVDQIDSIIKIIGIYFGEQYYEEIINRGKNIELGVFRGRGKVELESSEIYLGDEPVCIKNDEMSQILLPVSFLGDRSGNVCLVHLLLHALLTDCYKTKYSDFNEVLIDYIAEDISKMLETNNINVTLEENPVYKSNSFYSKFFGSIDQFIKDNREEIFECLVNGEFREVKGLTDIAKRIEKDINSLVFSDASEEMVNKIKR